jgi:hypothetical protein
VAGLTTIWTPGSLRIETGAGDTFRFCMASELAKQAETSFIGQGQHESEPSAALTSASACIWRVAPSATNLHFKRIHRRPSTRLTRSLSGSLSDHIVFIASPSSDPCLASSSREQMMIDRVKQENSAASLPRHEYEYQYLQHEWSDIMRSWGFPCMLPRA